MLAVVLGLQVLVSEPICGHDHVHRQAATLDVEAPFAVFDPGNGLLLRDLPGRSVAVSTADVRDPLVRVRAVALVDAEDFVPIRHEDSPCLLRVSKQNPLRTPHIKARGVPLIVMNLWRE